MGRQMRTARKKKAADSGDGPAEKRNKLDKPKIDGYNILLEYEGDDGNWIRFNLVNSFLATDAYNNGDDDAVITLHSGVKLKIILDKMVQKNMTTGWERRLKCCLLDKSDDKNYGWAWKDEKSIWNFYNVKSTIELENSYKSDQSDVPLIAFGRAYTVNITKMEQKNDATGVIRKVQRMISTLHLPKNQKEAQEEAGKSEEVDAKPSTSTESATSGRGKSSASARKGKIAPVEKSTVFRKTLSASEVRDLVRTVVVKGKAPVDPECDLVGKAHVLFEGNTVWDCMLNQTNLQNNNNKYYLIQILEDDKAKKYSVWMRWGRVGKTGQRSLVPCASNLEQAKNVFCKKFSDKTKNDWSSRAKFTKIPGKYDLVEMDYEADDSPAPDSAPKKDVKVPDSKLDKKVQDLINLICDVKTMEDAVLEMKYDARKAPLGKLKASQIKAGYAALKKIDQCITVNNMGNALIAACDEFYTRIPHDFGMKQPPIIRSKQDVKAKLGLLEALADIEVAMTIIKKSVVDENPIDTHYNLLDCALEPMEKSDDMYKMLDKYLQNTHAPTHNQYTMTIMDVFQMDKGGADSNFLDKGNRQLLWHGSRLTNWVGILSQGLRIAPPEAPVTGYMFGKGVYFADMSSKSANYCYPTRAKNIGLLLLCEVSLGDCNELMNADYKADKLPADKHSVWGKGRVIPDPALTHTMEDGTIVPLGKHKDSKLVNPSGYTLNYNEFIVYDTKQIKMKYLLKIKYNFR